MTVSSCIRSRFTYAAALTGAIGVLLLAPATAHADGNDHPAGTNGCTYSDTDGYPVPIDDGQNVFVEGKMVGCRGSTLVTSTAPKKNENTLRPPVIGHDLPAFGRS
jgi:hypothetical protein